MNRVSDSVQVGLGWVAHWLRVFPFKPRLWRLVAERARDERCPHRRADGAARAGSPERGRAREEHPGLAAHPDIAAGRAPGRQAFAYRWRRGTIRKRLTGRLHGAALHSFQHLQESIPDLHPHVKRLSDARQQLLKVNAQLGTIEVRATVAMPAAAARPLCCCAHAGESAGRIAWRR
jgi:hypothetical protein